MYRHECCLFCFLFPFFCFCCFLWCDLSLHPKLRAEALLLCVWMCASCIASLVQLSISRMCGRRSCAQCESKKISTNDNNTPEAGYKTKVAKTVVQLQERQRIATYPHAHVAKYVHPSALAKWDRSVIDKLVRRYGTKATCVPLERKRKKSTQI